MDCIVIAIHCSLTIISVNAPTWYNATHNRRCEAPLWCMATGTTGRLDKDKADWVFLLLSPSVTEHRSLLVVFCFHFYQNLRVVPHGIKGTGPGFVTRPVYLRSQLRNNTNTVSTLILLVHLLHVLCTQHTGIAHHRALQTSGRGWADSKAVHGMECSGACSLHWRSLSAGAAA